MITHALQEDLITERIFHPGAVLQELDYIWILPRWWDSRLGALLFLNVEVPCGMELGTVSGQQCAVHEKLQSTNSHKFGDERLPQCTVCSQIFLGGSAFRKPN
jgi:hypothetical protein